VDLPHTDHSVYPGGCYELFNDTCREETTPDLLTWLEKAI